MAGKPDFSWIIGGDISQFKKAMADAEKSVQDFTKRNEAAFKKLDTLTAPAAAVFAGLALTIGATAKAFGDFEAVLNEIQAVSGATTAEMEKMKAVALELGKSTKFSAKEAAQGMAELSKAGFTAGQAMEAIPGVLSLAAAGGVSVAQAAEAAGAALNGFGLAADDAGKVADIMAKAANLSAVSVGDLQNSLKYIAPIAASTSQSIEEVSTALVIMGNAGIKSEQAGTTIRSALVSLSKPSKDAADVMHRLGVSVQDTQGKMLPLTAILDQLRTKTAGMSEVQRANAIATIFGAEAMSGMLAIMKQTPAQVAASAAAVRDYAGAADEMAGVMNQGLNASLEQLGGSLETAAALMGEQFAPAIRGVASALQVAVDVFSKTPPELKAVAAALAVGATAASLAVVGFTAFGSILPGLAAGVGALGLTINTALPLIGALSLAVAAVTAVYTANATAQQRETQALADASRQRVKTVADLKSQRDGLKDLVIEHDKLANKSKLSKDEQARLKAIQDKLKADYPELAKQIQQAGDKHWATSKAVAEEIRLKNKLIDANRRLAEIAAKSNQVELEQASSELAELKQRRQDLLEGLADIGDGRVRVAQTSALDQMIRDKERQVRSVAQRTMNSVSEAAKIKNLITPAKVADPVVPGAVVGAGHVDKPSGGKTEAERAADEAHRKAVARLQDLIARYERLTRVQRSFGGGNAAELKNQEALLKAIKANGLDKIEEGQQAIIESQLRITELRGQAAVKAKEEADQRQKAASAELAEIEAAIAKDNEFLENRNKAMADANSLIALEAPDLVDAQEAEDLREIRDGYRDIAGELTALAADPSLERIANFSRELVGNPERLERWAQAIQMSGAKLAELKGPIEGASTGLAGLMGELGGLGVLGVIGASVAVAVVQFKLLADMYDKTAGAAERARESSLAFADSLASIQFRLSQGIVTETDAANERLTALKDRLDQIGGRLREIARENQESIDGGAIAAINPTTWMGFLARFGEKNNLQGEKDAIQKELKAVTEGAIQQRFADATTTAMSQLNAGLIDQSGFDAQRVQAAESALADWLALRDKATDPAERERIQGQVDAYSDLLKTYRGLAATTDDLKKADDAAKEAAKRATEEILEAQERVNQQAQIRSDAEEKIAAAMAKQVDLRKQLADIDKQEREAIAGIQSEGIAIRQKSEVQDKRDRIATIQADAAERRQAIKEELERQAKEEAAQRRREEIAAYTQRVLNEGYTGPKPKKAATGGKLRGGIPGVDSIDVKAQEGELIVDNPTTRALEAFLSAFHQQAIPAPMLAAGGGASFGPVIFQISGDGRNGQDIGREAWRYFEGRLRAARLI